jgi:adenine-specific DNA-methyltransferase
MCFEGNADFKNELILALVNSKFISFYYYYFIFNQAIRTMHFMPGYADQLPVPKNYFTSQLPIITLVNQILAAKKENSQADTSALERQIDLMVYRLYGLSYEEVKLIDDSVKPEGYEG